MASARCRAVSVADILIEAPVQTMARRRAMRLLAPRPWLDLFPRGGRATIAQSSSRADMLIARPDLSRHAAQTADSQCRDLFNAKTVLPSVSTRNQGARNGTIRIPASRSDLRCRSTSDDY